jgi:hypothetical protein
MTRRVSSSVVILLIAGHMVTAGEQNARIRVTVDPRVELMSIIFHLAGNPEYNQGNVPSYVQDVDRSFGSFRDHAAVRLARELRSKNGVTYDAVMGMAVHVTDGFALQERVPFSPRPESLDSRWATESAREFLTLARQFVKDTPFRDFIDKHQDLYQVATRRAQDVLDKNAHLEWFDQFFGERKNADFHLILGMLNGGECYGPHFTGADGRENLYSVLGVWAVDAQGQPTFSADIVSTVVHEFTHSYTNALVDRFAKELRPAGEKLFALVDPEMKRQAYGNWKALMYESLNRACGLRYTLAFDGSAAMKKAVDYENSRSFYWVGELADVLARYDTQPRKYKDLAEFFPQVVAFFNEYARNADAKIAAIKQKKEQAVRDVQDKGPRIVSMIPANGAEDVDPNLKAIVVTFDRPMRDRSWSVVTLDASRFPKISGSLRYDATRKVFTAPVTLEPGKEYVFGLNAERYFGFRSQEGISLASVVVRFKTKATVK